MSSQCNVDGSKFSEPLPWIGLYIAAASLLCSLLMGLDTFLGFRSQKLWFPCRFFSLDATSLTLLTVATKLPVDLNASMPRPEDQLVKLSGTVLICTVMGNFMTSLGKMDGPQLIANVIAVGILVVTVIVNIGTQMGTGVIYAFFPEHAIVMFLMLALLLILCSTAMMVPAARELFEDKYNDILMSSGEEMFIYNEGLRTCVMKHCVMAVTGNVQYAVGRSATCTASGAFCLLSALILGQAAVRSLIIRSVAFCEGKSDYTWSVTLILISQAAAIGFGTIAPAIRLFDPVSFRNLKSWTQRRKGEFKVEKHYVQIMVEWKERPLPFDISNWRFSKILHGSKNQVLNVLIVIQSTVVIVSKLILLTSILPVSCLSRFSCCCKRLRREGEGSEFQSSSNLDRSRCVLHLDGESDLVPLLLTKGCEDGERWIRRGKSNPPNFLMQLLMKFTISQGFQGVVEFDSNKVPLLGTEEPPPNCWALPIVILTHIAIAIAPPWSKNEVKLLKRGVHESLKYVRLIEKNLDDRRLINMREAADIIWLGNDTNDHWLGKDLKNFTLGKSDNRILVDGESLDCDSWRILEELAECGKEDVLAYTTGSEKKEDPLDWPPRVLAANSMYRLCRTLLLKNLGTSDQMFEWLQKTIADIVGACLANLPRVISMTCVCSFIETREENVRDAAYLLGETEEILMKLEISYPDDHKEYIESWIPNNTAEP